MKIFLLKTPVEVFKLPSMHPTPLIRLRKLFNVSLKNSWISAKFKRRHRRPEGQGESSRKQEDE